MKIRAVLSLMVAFCLFAGWVRSASGEDSLTAVSWGENSSVYPHAVKNSLSEYRGAARNGETIKNDGICKSGAFTLHKQLSLSFEDKDRDYEETQLRRFEIIFFISLPVSLFFSFAGAALFKAAAEGEISFSSLDYSYILLSSAGISFTIAFRDNRAVYRKKAGKQEQQQ